MTVELSLVISIVSVGFAVITGIWNLSRNKKHDDKKEATELATVIVKLENISKDTSEIKSELRSVKSDVQDLHERVAIVEQSYKSLHKRVDKFEGRAENRD
ncbi:MAG: hypothetical protein J6J86_00670 [Lachnospiraceae bacterium]|nr:hypothetical protein [Lachnospiraceae bacterium]